MNEYNYEKQSILQKFINSLYNFRAYPYYLKETMGKAILYILLLAVITSLITSAKSIFLLSKGFSEFQNEVLTELPDFSLSNNGFLTNADMPLIYDDELNDMVVVIDNSEKTSEEILANYTSGVFILQDKVLVKENPINISEFYYSDLGGFSINNDELKSFMGTIKVIIYVVLLVLAPLFSFIGKLLSLTIILGVSGLIFNSLLKLPLTYGEICKLGAYALTTPVLIDTFLLLIGISIPFFSVIYYALALCYLFLGMKEVKNDLNQNFTL